MEHEPDNYQTSQYSDGTESEEEQFVIVRSKQPQNDAESAAGADETLIAAMQQLIDEMHSLQQDFDTKIKYDASKERQIDSLHNELQAYRAGLHFKILRPLILDLISMHDDIGRLVESIPRAEDMISVVQVLKNLEGFQITVEEILQRNGIESYVVEGETFVSGRQRALQAVETAEPALDRQIARRVSKGFEYDEKVLRPELVMTYRSIARA